MNRTFLRILLFTLVVFSAYSLWTGQGYLSLSIIGELPLGNILVATSLCALAYLSTPLTHYGKLGKAAVNISFGMALAWLPISILMAGNPRLNFSGDMSQYWNVLTITTTVLNISTCCLAISLRAWSKHQYAKSIKSEQVKH